MWVILSKFFIFIFFLLLELILEGLMLLLNLHKSMMLLMIKNGLNVLEVGSLHVDIFNFHFILVKEEVRTRLGSIVSPISPSSPIPFVSTGSPSSPQEIHKEPHPNRIRNFRYFVNGELEVSRSLGDYYLKKKHFNQKQWRYPTKEREAAGLTGFVDDVVSSTPYIK